MSVGYRRYRERGEKPVTVFQLPPAAAAWRHADAQDAFESVFVRIIAAGYEIDDHTAGVEAGVVGAVHTSITLDSS